MPRKNEEQHQLQSKYLLCETKTARAEFVKKYATRWSELSRLPYFDMCRMIVVDPMHNLFLGKVHTFSNIGHVPSLSNYRRCENTLLSYLGPTKCTT